MIADNDSTNPTCVNCPAGQTRGLGDSECSECSAQNQVVSDGQCQPCLDQNQLHYIYDDERGDAEDKQPSCLQSMDDRSFPRGELAHKVYTQEGGACSLGTPPS